MKCVQCGAEEFEFQNIKHSPTVKNEIVEVTIRSTVCKECGLPQLTDEQVNLFRRTAIDLYRERHNLLTSKNIIALREARGMSQKAFARYLDVDLTGLISWETYGIQDPSEDLRIRQKCAPQFAPK